MGFIKHAMGFVGENSLLSLLAPLFCVLAILVISKLFKEKTTVIRDFLHQNKTALVATISIYLFILAVWSLVYLPKMIVEKGENSAITRASGKKDGESEASLKPLTIKEYLDAEDNARKTIAQIFGAALVFIGFFLAWQRNQIQQKGQLTERFTKAIEQLGARDAQGYPVIGIRFGGIYALEKLAKESREYHGQIFETLTAYVRANAPWPPADLTSGCATPQETEPTMRKDIQAVLTVIGRRRWTVFEEARLDLSSTDLRKAELLGANLANAWLEKVNLEGATLKKVNFMGANLWKANLRSAILDGANLMGASAREANFTSASLRETNFMSSKLYEANLTNVCLEGAKFTHVSFGLGAISELDAIGLTLDQIKLAKNYDKAILPTYLKDQLTQDQQNSTPPTQA